MTFINFLFQSPLPVSSLLEQPVRHRGYLGRRRTLTRYLGGDLRRVDSRTGEVLERLEMPAGADVSGLESDGGDRFFCGGGRSGKVRTVRRPKLPTEGREP
jgi:hypothetical protein